MLPSNLLVGCAYQAQVVGAALLAASRGQGRRTIAAQLAVPASTVARWTRRFTALAEQLRGHLIRRIVAVDQELVPLVARGHVRADALEALGALARAVTRRFKTGLVDPWRLVALEAADRLLSPRPTY
jgi:hypothetical protein